jgi:hypothetical protein
VGDLGSLLIRSSRVVQGRSTPRLRLSVAAVAGQLSSFFPFLVLFRHTDRFVGVALRKTMFVKYCFATSSE